MTSCHNNGNGSRWLKLLAVPTAIATLLIGVPTASATASEAVAGTAPVATQSASESQATTAKGTGQPAAGQAAAGRPSSGQSSTTKLASGKSNAANASATPQTATSKKADAAKGTSAPTPQATATSKPAKTESAANQSDAVRESAQSPDAAQTAASSTSAPQSQQSSAAKPAAEPVYGYVISFDSQGGTEIGHTATWMKNDTTGSNKEEWVDKVNSPTRSGYRFQCWSTQKDDVDCTHNLSNIWNTLDGITSDMTVYAQWKGNRVRIYIGSETSGNFVDVNYGEIPADNPEFKAPAKDDCTFDHWSLGEYDNGRFDPSKPLDKPNDFSAYPQYLCTITFDTQGGSAINPIQAPTGISLDGKLPANPTRPGYTFDQWTYDAAGEQRFFSTREVRNAFTLYAQWTEKPKFDVTFNGNGGAPDTQTYHYVVGDYNDPSSIETPARTGYRFQCWSTKQDDAACAENLFGAKDDQGNTPFDKLTGATTAYAQWQAVPVRIYIDGGVNVSGVKHITVNYGEVPQLPEPAVKDGCTFDHWSLDEADDSAFDPTKPIDTEENFSVYAQYLCTVTFATQGGSELDPIQVPTGKPLSGKLPADPVRDGYTFAGWTYDAAGDQQFFPTRMVKGALTLYAQWKENPKPVEYTVTFDSQDGSATAPVKVESGKTVTKPADPTRDGYVFAGWTTDEAGKVAYDFATPVTGDLTLYAQWTKQGGTTPETPDKPDTDKPGENKPDVNKPDDQPTKPESKPQPQNGQTESKTAKKTTDKTARSGNKLARTGSSVTAIAVAAVAMLAGAGIALSALRRQRR